jgi:HSP20 family protein
MFNSLFNVESSLFDEFRRMEQEMDELFGRGPWPAGLVRTQKFFEKGKAPPPLIEN